MESAKERVDSETFWTIRTAMVTPMNEIINQTFEGAGQKHIHRLAEHHGIYRDLFGDSFFYPSVFNSNMALLNHDRVGYTDLEDSEMIQPVYYGNLMAPAEVRSCPEVFYKSKEGKFYTLCLVAPDSHLEENNQEYLHWMVTNIPGNAVDQGDVLYKYMPVFPVHGTGTHRYVFLLYQHDARLDLSIKPETTDSPNLNERTFNTQQFYINHMSSITPVGLCFYQAEWDRSVRDTFHKVLDMEEPRFEFLPPSEYIPKQKIWPEWESFNKYMDTYREKKEIGEQVLKEKLKTGHPFKPRSPRPRYPLIFKPKGKMATWLLIQEHEKRLRKSYWKALDD
ncbi:RM38-like protein [Mya arenaria]|uniref:Large ribosomal subunit protein mL38 n=1 Tax=Mya arenaria TaxID=6604 RepID=A0ABY7EUJ0_MYAAR|nr:RM38-like protein [Mya arenaria]